MKKSNAAAAQDDLGRRAHTRHNMTRFVWYHTIDDDNDGKEGKGQPVEGLSYCVDVSFGGLGVVVKEPIPMGARVFVLIVFHRDQYNLSAVCRVAHTCTLEDGSFRLGLEYVVVPPDAREYLAKHFK